MPISSRIGPLTSATVACDVVELERPDTPLAAIARMTGKVVPIERVRKPVDHRLDERGLVDRVRAVDVRAQLGGRAADDRLRDERLPQGRHAVGRGNGTHETREHVRMHGNGGYTCRLQRHGEPNDRWATRASKAYSENRRVAVGFDARAQLRVVDPAFLGARYADVGCRQMFAEPLSQLFDEQVGVVEQAIDEIDRLAFEILQAR